jgi:hypothetical protein
LYPSSHPTSFLLCQSFQQLVEEALLEIQDAFARFSEENESHETPQSTVSFYAIFALVSVVVVVFKFLVF